MSDPRIEQDEVVPARATRPGPARSLCPRWVAARRDRPREDRVLDHLQVGGHQDTTFRATPKK